MPTDTERSAIEEQPKASAQLCRLSNGSDLPRRIRSRLQLDAERRPPPSRTFTLSGRTTNLTWQIRKGLAEIIFVGARFHQRGRSHLGRRLRRHVDAALHEAFDGRRTL